MEACRAWRLAQVKTGDAYKLADRPHLLRPCGKFQDGTYIGVPKVSSERRDYIPMGFVSDGMIPGNQLYFVPTDSLYVFGVLVSRAHNAWMRVVAGRLKSDYRYGNTTVYNNLVWPDAAPAERERIEHSAQGILEARSHYPDASLATLYDPDLMPSELREAHRENDRAAAKTIIEASRLLKSGKVSVGLFPEGYTSKTCELLPFRNGAFKVAYRAEAPIAVCVINNTRSIPKELFWRRTEIKLNVLEVIPYENYKDMHTVELGDKIHDMMQTELKRLRGEN